MGLFSSKPKRNFLEILGLKITPDIESRLVERKKEENFTDYSIDITENFGLFDRAIFRIFSHRCDLSGESSFNLILENDGQSVTIDKIQNMVDLIANEYGKDRTGRAKWDILDDREISTNWEGREWIIDKKGKTHKLYKMDCIQVNLYFSIEKGIGFSILGASELLKN